jgi:GT2 family glycosyltransferase
MYWEDEDLCRRVHMTGAKIALVPAAVFYHLHSYTTDTENKEEIKSNDFYSEMIYSLKDPSGSVPRILYSVFVNVCHLFIYFFLKGQWKKCFLQIKAMFVMLFNLPAIIKSRKNDMQISDINNQNYALQK